ncbi:UNKNOWN [Stylonychia lemnae]|uniref:Transmembrane protein n=1 Tax=Stylonychia lemnae TaxID=5949 RepID=A0A078ALD6_STYLE|nr:UNKNOWN [Stylonychia lemnae]|eukprot:CDW82222.1 UNKNOWN [Stylonychia lemnae]
MAIQVNTIRWVNIIQAYKNKQKSNTIQGLYFFMIAYVSIVLILKISYSMTAESSYSLVQQILDKYVQGFQATFCMIVLSTYIYIHYFFRKYYDDLIERTKNHSTVEDVQSFKRNKKQICRFFEILIFAIVIKIIPEIVFLIQLNSDSEFFFANYQLYLEIMNTVIGLSELLMMLILAQSIKWSMITYDKFLKIQQNKDQNVLDNQFSSSLLIPEDMDCNLQVVFQEYKSYELQTTSSEVRINFSDESTQNSLMKCLK